MIYDSSQGFQWEVLCFHIETFIGVKFNLNQLVDQSNKNLNVKQPHIYAKTVKDRDRRAWKGESAIWLHVSTQVAYEQGAGTTSLVDNDEPANARPNPTHTVNVLKQNCVLRVYFITKSQIPVWGGVLVLELNDF